MKKFFTFCLLMIGSVHAQESQAPVVRVGINGAYLRTNISAEQGAGNEAGIAIEASRRFTSRFELSFIAARIQSDEPYWIFAAGPQFRRNLSGILPATDTFDPSRYEFFIRAWAGGTRQVQTGATTVRWTHGYGGGVEWIANDRIRWRLIGADYFRTQIVDRGRIVRNNVKISTGVHFKIF